MELITSFLNELNGLVWGKPMLFMILGTGIFLMLGLRFMPILNLGKGFKLLWQGRKATDKEGEITPFNALMTALSATVGTGNIAGVATAVFLGGPGALFWMWITGLVGMATKYAEAVLAVKYRNTNSDGTLVGGPMWYISQGLGLRWLGWLFAFFGALAAFGKGKDRIGGNPQQRFKDLQARRRGLLGPDLATHGKRHFRFGVFPISLRPVVQTDLVDDLPTSIGLA